jgi:hypothetical protein
VWVRQSGPGLQPDRQRLRNYKRQCESMINFHLMCTLKAAHPHGAAAKTLDGQIMPVHVGDKAAKDTARDMHCPCPPIGNRSNCVTRHVVGSGTLRARARMIGGCENSRVPVPAQPQQLAATAAIAVGKDGRVVCTAPIPNDPIWIVCIALCANNINSALQGCRAYLCHNHALGIQLDSQLLTASTAFTGTPILPTTTTAVMSATQYALQTWVGCPSHWG